MILTEITEKQRSLVLRTRPNPNECCVVAYYGEANMEACGALARWAYREAPGALGTSYYCDKHARELMHHLAQIANEEADQLQVKANVAKRRKQEALDMLAILDAAESAACDCWTCLKGRGESVNRMIVCSLCGNKRCPHGTDHNLACTRSNAPDQEGSRYGPTPPPLPLPTFKE